MGSLCFDGVERQVVLGSRAADDGVDGRRSRRPRRRHGGVTMFRSVDDLLGARHQVGVALPALATRVVVKVELDHQFLVGRQRLHLDAERSVKLDVFLCPFCVVFECELKGCWLDRPTDGATCCRGGGVARRLFECDSRRRRARRSRCAAARRYAWRRNSSRRRRSSGAARCTAGRRRRWIGRRGIGARRPAAPPADRT